MGTDKGSLPFGGESMLDRIIRILSTITEHTIVVGRRDQAAVTVLDAVEDQGPLAGIVAGLSASKTELNLVVACDMPLINPAVLQRLATMIGVADCCVAVVDGRASALCGVYRSRVAPIAKSMLDSGERRVMQLFERVDTQRVDATVFHDVDPSLNTFKNCNTPDEYRAALSRTGVAT